MPGQGPLKLLDALPNYLGSKREQSATIFRELAQNGFPAGISNGSPVTLLDPFMGGGSIALTAKALGYRVIAGDTSARSEAVGRGVIENRSTRLNEDDIAYALTMDPAGWYLPPLKQLPWPEDSRRLLASIAKAADTYESFAKRHLMRAWLVKFATAISIYGQPRMTAHQRIRDKNWDAMTPGQVDRILEPQTKPRPVAQQTARAINEAVFSNGHRNEFFRGDVLDFIDKHAAGAHVIYLDPPYPDTEGYGRNYVGLDAILENRELDIDEGRFAAADGWKFLGDVFHACKDVPLCVVSLGAEVKHVNVDELTELMGTAGDWNVEAKTLEYGLLRSRATSKSERKREYMLVGSRS